MTEHHNEYDDQFVAGLEWMWGEGFMSPGGPAEVAEILQGVEIEGKRVLDIGCGIAGIDILLVQKHGAAHVTGIDVEAPLIERAAKMVAAAGLSDQITCQLVAPGPLPFDDNSFDLVFSKDAMIHIPDKAAIYTEIHRVLNSGGQMAISDWFGSDYPKTPEYQEWMEVIGITLEMGTLEAAAAMLQVLGFERIDTNDRNAWYAQNILDELATLQGENFAALVAEQGEDFAKRRLKSSSLKKSVVDQGLLRPGHIRATVRK